MSTKDRDFSPSDTKYFAMMSAYLDESYNDHTIVIGGWIGSEKTWRRIGKKWAASLACENRASKRMGLPPISRYHAADCSSRTGEFENWPLPKQIKFCKSLLRIMTTHLEHDKPMAFAWGASLNEFRSVFAEESEDWCRRRCYQLCAADVMRQIGQVMVRFYPHEKVTIIHDQGGLCDSAQAAFRWIKQNFNGKSWAKPLLTMAPMSWEDAIELQPADMIAYDLFKSTDGELRDRKRVRRSLESLVGAGTPMLSGYTAKGVFRDIAKWTANPELGPPPWAAEADWWS